MLEKEALNRCSAEQLGQHQWRATILVLLLERAAGGDEQSHQRELISRGADGEHQRGPVVGVDQIDAGVLGHKLLCNVQAARRGIVVRVTFGAAFINGVLGGYHRDFAKIVLLGKELGLGTKAELSKLELTVLRERVAEAVLATEDGKLPTSTTFVA